LAERQKDPNQTKFEKETDEEKQEDFQKEDEKNQEEKKSQNNVKTLLKNWSKSCQKLSKSFTKVSQPKAKRKKKN
jgi:hypothetical protein